MVLPIMNVGKTENKGYEFQLKWNDKIGDDFRYWANFNLSFARNKIVYKNEIEKNEDWLYETGRTIGSRLIYKFGDIMMKLQRLDIRKNLVDL